MSRKCPITNKGPQTGNKRSRSLQATRRSWGVNVQPFKVEVNGRMKTVHMSARAYRSLTKSQRGR